MRKSRILMVFAGATLVLSLVALGIFPSRELAPRKQQSGVHFKIRGGPDSLRAMHIQGDVSPLFSRERSALEADRLAALALGASDIPDLSAWYRADNVADPHALVVELLAMPEVRQAFVAPILELAILTTTESSAMGDSCPVHTPGYDERQGYLAQAPGGIDVAAAWKLPGGRGQNVAFADIEGSWNQKHEDLPGERMRLVAGRNIADRHWEAHGTAVVGVVASKDNDLGMVGIAPEVSRVVTASIDPIGAAAAIDEAQSNLRPGDVLLIELHSIGPRNRYLPMEFWDDVFDAVKLATSRGVVVVAAAGNGGENLDHKGYKRKFDRSFRDSGAILVGAGAPNRPGYNDRSRLDFSNYGKRVDVQGWGRGVATLDYGDLQDCGSPHRRKYTDLFSGTSSASPVVAGAAVLLQSIFKEQSSRVLSPVEMRELLRRTGSPQRDGWRGKASRQPIGPRPDLARAIAELPTR